jgi:hypothetical protein
MIDLPYIGELQTVAIAIVHSIEMGEQTSLNQIMREIEDVEHKIENMEAFKGN